MQHTLKKLFALTCLLSSTTFVYPQSGCFDSPEAPTGALMLIGSAGMFFGSSLIKRAMGRRCGR